MATVLVVDDSAVDRRLAGGLLEKGFPCTVRYATDGKDALADMTRELPDLVLTDLQMPVMNGLELVDAVRSEYPLIPVILMTAQGSEEIAAQALQHGAASYVPKRKLADDLVPTVLRVLLGALEDRAHSNLMHYLDAGMVTFVLPNNRSLIQALVAHVQEMLRSLPLEDETERLRVGIALEEALDNALYHGNLEIGATLGRPDREACEQLARERSSQAPYRDRRIHVSIRLSRDEAVFVIRDDGPGFDASKLPEGADLAEEESEAGRGINLMRTFMDEVRYNDRGNEVTLIKRRVREAPPEEPKPGDAGQA